MQIVPSASGTAPYTLAPLPTTLQLPPSDADATQIDRLPHGTLPHWKAGCGTCLTKGEDGVFSIRLADGTVSTCECRCREQWILKRRMQAANIDDAYARLGWDHATGVPQQAAEEVLRYVGDLDTYLAAGVGLTLFSDRRGTGKSLMTSLILKEAMAQGKSVFFIRFLDLLDLFSRTWKDDDTEAWFVRRIESADMIGIDDIGKEGKQERNFGGMIDRLLDRMLRGRVANGRVMIVNSNLDPDAETGFGRYQQDVLELLSEVNEIVPVHGTSFRAERRARKLSDARDGVRYPVVVR